MSFISKTDTSPLDIFDRGPVYFFDIVEDYAHIGGVAAVSRRLRRALSLRLGKRLISVRDIAARFGCGEAGENYLERERRAIEALATLDPASTFLIPNFQSPLRLVAGRAKPVVINLVHDVQFAALPKLFSTEHRDWLHRAFAETRENADTLVFVSQSTKEQFAGLFGAPRRAAVVPVPIGEAVSDTVPNQDAGKFLLAVQHGECHPHKNVEGLLRLFANISATDPNLSLVVTGRGQSHFQRAREKLPLALQSRAFHAGYVSRAELTKLYRDATAFVSLSRFEGFNMPAAEAAVEGTPLILSDLPVHRELHGQAACFLNLDAPDAVLARAFLMSTAQRPRLPNQALAKACSAVSIASVYASLIDLSLRAEPKRQRERRSLVKRSSRRNARQGLCSPPMSFNGTDKLASGISSPRALMIGTIVGGVLLSGAVSSPALAQSLSCVTGVAASGGAGGSTFSGTQWDVPGGVGGASGLPDGSAGSDQGNGPHSVTSGYYSGGGGGAGGECASQTGGTGGGTQYEPSLGGVGSLLAGQPGAAGQTGLSGAGGGGGGGYGLTLSFSGQGGSGGTGGAGGSAGNAGGGGGGGGGGLGTGITANATLIGNSSGGAGGSGGSGGYNGNGGSGGTGGAGTVIFNVGTEAAVEMGVISTGGDGGDGGASLLTYSSPGIFQSGGNGGNGGAGVLLTEIGQVLSNDGNIKGGSGGAGGNGLFGSNGSSGILGGSAYWGSGYGGSGGNGASGVSVTGVSRIVNAGTIAGGNGGSGGSGGAGGNAADAGTGGHGGSGGAGGNGGVGLLFVNAGSLVNTGSITGGNGSFGGAGGIGGAGGPHGGIAGAAGALGSAGYGGAGVVGSGVDIINTGIISGGLGANPMGTRTAVLFTGGINSISYGGSLNGGVNVAAGSFAPAAAGSSIGQTLAIDGFVTFAAGTSYKIRVSSSGSDSVLATGTATINGGSVNVLAGAGNYAPATTYTILTATGGRLGTFTDGVTSSLAFLDPSLSYDANNVYLTMTRNHVNFADIGITRNQIATGGSIATLGQGNAVYDAFLNLSAPQAQYAFDQLSGEIHASAKTAMIEDSRFVRSAINDRMRAAFDTLGASGGSIMTDTNGQPAAIAANTDGLAVWGQGFGSWGHWNSDGNAAKLDRSIGGFLLGADTSVFDTWRLGAVAGYSHTSLTEDTLGSTGSSDNYHVGLYGGTNWGDLGFRTGAAFTWNALSMARSVQFPGFLDSLKTNYNAATVQVFSELSYRIEANNIIFEPFANLAYVNLHTDGFTERGGAAALNSSSGDTDTAAITLGSRATISFDLDGTAVTANGMLGWRFGYDDVKPNTVIRPAGGAEFSIDGIPVARYAAVVEAGLDFTLSPTTMFGVSYDAQFGSGMAEQTFRASLNVKF